MYNGETLGDLAAERAILGAIAQHGAEGLYQINDILETGSFSDSNNQIFFKVLSSAVDKSTVIDIPLVLSTANDLGLYEFISSKENKEYLQAIFSIPVRIENIRQFAIKLKKIEIIKDSIHALDEAKENIQQCTGSEDIHDILAKLEDPIFNLSFKLSVDNQEQPTKLFEDAEEFLKFKEENPCDIIGIATGFPIYDEIIGGGQRRKTFNLIVARPKCGKSLHAKQVGIHVSSQDIPVLLLDTEMSKEDQIIRALASLSQTRIREIETGEFGSTNNKDLLYKVAIENKETPLFYKNIAGKPFEEILAVIRRWVMTEVGFDENGTTKDCLVIYDYFKLMDSSELNKLQEYQVMGFQISKMTDFCSRYDIPCLGYVQANRDGISKESTDIISQSDRILWLCSSVCFLKKKTGDEMQEEGLLLGNRKLIPLDAIRHGAGLDDHDWINYNLVGEYGHFEEMDTRFNSQKENVEVEDAI